MTTRASTRVFITGMSVISPLGNSLDRLWNALSSRQSGVRSLEQSPDRLAVGLTHGAPAAEFTGTIDDFGELDKDRKRAIRKGLKLMCREIQMGVAAAQLALQHARLTPGSYDPTRTGVTYGCDHIVTRPEEFAEAFRACTSFAESGPGPGESCGKFDFATWARHGLPQVTPLWLLKYLPNMPASHIAIYNDLRGPNNSLTYRESSGNLAVGEAFATIQRGSADCMLAGATGCHLHPLKSLYMLLQNQVATSGNSDSPGLPEHLSRPFDLGRTGQVAGEGAAALVLESEAHARARGATIVGEVLGHGSAVAVAAGGAARLAVALRGAAAAALRSARIRPADVGHVHAHGLATVQSDIEEAQALRDVFGDHLADVPVVAAKSYFGNLGAASGVVELICSLLAMQHGTLFPILNCETPDPRCRLPVVTTSRLDNGPPDHPRPGTTTLNLSCSPQGQASAVVARSLAE